MDKAKNKQRRTSARKNVLSPPMQNPAAAVTAHFQEINALNEKVREGVISKEEAWSILQEKTEKVSKLLKAHIVSLSKVQRIEVGELLADRAAESPGEILRRLRKEKGLSQVQLAKSIGATQPSIAEIEAGRRSFGRKMAAKIAEVLGVDYRIFL